MKYFVAGLLSIAAVYLYMVVFNYSTLSWIPFVYAVLMIAYWYAERTIAYFMALVAGVAMDMHFYSLGMYVLMYLGAIQLLVILEGLISQRMSLLGITLGTLTVSLWSVAGLVVLLGVTNGFVFYVTGVSALYSLLILVFKSWAILLGVYALSRMIRLMYRYAWG